MKIEVTVIEENGTRRTVPCVVGYGEIIHVNKHDKTINIISRDKIPQHFNGVLKGKKLKY